MADFAELKQIVESIREDLRSKATTAKIDELLLKINEKDELITTLQNRIENLDSRLKVVENTNTLLERRCDDLESYTRRQNLRIVGIPEPDDASETSEDCLTKVKEEISKLDGVHVNLDVAIDRAHRVGPKKDRQGNPIQRPMIVRFTSWRSRTHVYIKRNKERREVRFYVDLTKRRVDLKKKAIEKTQNNHKVSFVYADVNNNVCLMLSDDRKKIFNSEDELDRILASI